MTHFFKELSTLRNDFEEQNGRLKAWREKLAGDM